ncbi:MAG: ribonuclease PH [Planctomycetota bacterium]
MARDRPDDALRPIQIVPRFLERNPTSVLYVSGGTKVLSTASLAPVVPAFLEGRGQGWATAEYDLLPGSTQPRHARERNGRISGRTQEIQRMIGRCIRGVLDLTALEGFTLTLDCDVLQADGGTRTAATNGAWISASLLARDAVARGVLARSPIREGLGAVSAGIVRGRRLLDLDYEEDSAADVDLNIVATESGKLVEVQAASEGTPFSLEELDALVRLGFRGIREIIEAARRSLAP